MALLLIASATASGCWKWSGTDDFVGALECGMSEAAIQSAASGFGLEVANSNDLGFGELVASRSGTMIWMDLDERAELTGVIYSWEDGIMSAAYSLKQNLCTHKEEIVLRVGAPAELGGGRLYLDGEQVDTLSPRLAVADIDVPLGNHQLRIEKCGYRSWVTEVAYDGDDGGYHVIDVPAPQPDPAARC